jgi:uncharacterized protein (TIGR03118 family)
MLKLKIVFYLFCLILFAVGFTAINTTAQSIAYRQTNLASSVPNVANNLTPGLLNPWGIGFLSGQPFFIAENKGGHVTSLDATGLGALPGGFIVPDVTGTGFETPTGIVADQNSSFGDASVVKPFILVTEQGTILTWGPDALGDFPQQATPRRRIANAVFKGAAILNSTLTTPALAVTDFHGGFIDVFLPVFAPVALPGSFTDPTLPPGYAPFGIQVIGNQVFVTYALQDAAKHDPIFGAGNGIVSIFDMDGNFVKRFATGGALNAPWGIAKASGSFGPFSNDILIGNVGDGNINAFDPATGQLIGVLVDGDGTNIAEVGLHALAFRADGFGDPNTLYFTSQINNENDGLFGGITAGLVSTIRISVPNTAVDANATITAHVTAGPGNTGSPTGTVTFLDGSISLGAVPLVGGSASLDAIFADAGIHAITAQYSGDRVFLPRSERIPLQVTGIATTSTLIAPAAAAPGSTVTLTATINSAGGIPTGQATFLDETTILGTAPLNGAGVAILRINTLAVGTHSLAASYSGDGKFDVSTSTVVTLNVASADFALGANPSTATVTAGHSTQFMLTVTPSGGFANSVSFSCPPVTGITCNFNPPTVTPASGAASTTLTVTTSAAVSRYGLLMPDQIGPWALLGAIALFSLAMWRARNLSFGRVSPLAASVAIIVTLGLAVGGCGGYANNSQANRGTATIMVAAQSGTVSHTTTVSVTVQ